MLRWGVATLHRTRTGVPVWVAVGREALAGWVSRSTDAAVASVPSYWSHRDLGRDRAAELAEALDRGLEVDRAELDLVFGRRVGHLRGCEADETGLYVVIALDPTRAGAMAGELAARGVASMSMSVRPSRAVRVGTAGTTPVLRLTGAVLTDAGLTEAPADPGAVVCAVDGRPVAGGVR